jgi:hypothetical protein
MTQPRKLIITFVDEKAFDSVNHPTGWGHDYMTVTGQQQTAEGYKVTYDCQLKSDSDWRDINEELFKIQDQVREWDYYEYTPSEDDAV